jgi:hypothetical protein
MAILIPDTRQTVLVATVAFGFADLAASGVGTVALALPQGAVVTGGQMVIDTAFNGSVSVGAEIGDAGSAARYLGATSILSTGRTALVPTGYQVVNANRDILIEVTLGGTANSAGAGRLQVEYIVEGRSIENFE